MGQRAQQQQVTSFGTTERAGDRQPLTHLDGLLHLTRPSAETTSPVTSFDDLVIAAPGGRACPKWETPSPHQETSPAHATGAELVIDEDHMREPTAPSEPTAVFEPDGELLVPTEAARGPWNPDVLHGAAVAALLAGLLEAEDQVTVRVLVELHGPVPHQPLTIEVGPSDGGRRVKRQSATLCADGRPVASASVTRIRLTEVTLPDGATDHPLTFDPAATPDLTAPNRHAAGVVGWRSFDSLAMATRWERSEGPGPRKLWLRLLMPIVAGQEPSGAQRAVAAADYGTNGTFARLPWAQWSYMNADLTVSLSRPPVGEWIGMETDGIVQPTGTGLSIGQIHDRAGRVGQSAQSLLIEPR